jgi:hypothetical protein
MVVPLYAAADDDDNNNNNNNWGGNRRKQERRTNFRSQNISENFSKINVPAFHSIHLHPAV